MLEFIKTKHKIKKITPLRGGFSFCEKYKADNSVLKIFSMNEYEKMKERMEFLEFLDEKKLHVPKIIAYGTYQDKCYQILSYLEGETGAVISNYPLEMQYNIGYESGKELKEYHTYKRPEQIDIYDFHKKKYEKMLQEYKGLGIQFKYEVECIQYIEKNIESLKNRETVQLHGDYHPENMCFTINGYVGAYDFERNKKTDYVREFERALFFTRQFSVEYVKGLLDGYQFTEFSILKLYLAMSIFNSFVWAKKFYPEQLEEFHQYSEKVIEDFDLLKGDKPKYLGE